MKTTESAPLLLEGFEAYDEVAGIEPSPLNSPFAANELQVAEGKGGAKRPPESAVVSPFSEAFTTVSAVDEDAAVTEMLLGELDDEEFTGALDMLLNEAAARHMRGSTGWSHEQAVPVLDPAGTTEWVEGIGTEVDRALAELEERFADRPVESVTDEEVDAALAAAIPRFESVADPLDAQELFWGGLKKKLKKVARAAKKVVKKGISVASKVMPLGIIYRRLRSLIKPLLRRVLARAIGKLPPSLRGPARKLARSHGLAREFEGEAESYAADFDSALAEAMTATDWEALEAELEHDTVAIDEEPNVAGVLDAARERLVQQLLEAEAGSSPVEDVEQFIPAAILPVVRTGIRLIGRRKVVNFIAGLLAKLIAPVVGKQLARPLSVQIADKGLGLLSLEAEAAGGRLGAEAVVASLEETLAEVFSMPEELLENELFVEAAVQEAFHAAAARHFPASFLKSGGAAGTGADGVWVMMPRATAPLYRYRKYSRAVPAQLTREMAREVVFSDGETLEERLSDAGETTWPVDIEVESYDLLPGAEPGQIAAFEAESAPPEEALLEFDTLEEAGPLPLPYEVREASRRPGRARRMVRVRVHGKTIRRRSPLSIRLDLSGPQPVIRLSLWVSERRAGDIARQLTNQQHRDVVAAFAAISRPPIRRAVAKRLGRILSRRRLPRDAEAVDTLSNQLFDGLLGAVAQQLPTMASTLSAAAKDPASGLTVIAAFPFDSADAIGSAAPGTPTLTIRAGRYRD